MKSVAQAQEFFAAYPAKAKEIETVVLAQALGRVSAQAVYSVLDIPPENNSAMDGIAINSADFREVDAGIPLLISQRIPAGQAPEPLQRGTAARIFTGGVIPAGADCVVIQENCQFFDDSPSSTGPNPQSSVQILSKPNPGDNIRPAGQDIQHGAEVIAQGQVLNPVDISLLSSIGVSKVAVRRRLKVAIFSTGDELVEPGHALKSGQIYNSNRVLLHLLCQQFGAEVIDIGLVEDTQPATEKALLDAADKADLIISSGGVSVGDEDHIKPAVENIGTLDFWKVQMKPGKPVAFGRIENSVFMGLPGNPVSSFVVFQLMAAPLLQALQGVKVSLPKAISVRSNFDKSESSRDEYIRVRLSTNEDGTSVVERFGNLSSGVLSSLSWADGLVKQSANNTIKSGDLLDFLPLRNSSLW